MSPRIARLRAAPVAALSLVFVALLAMMLAPPAAHAVPDRAPATARSAVDEGTDPLQVDIDTISPSVVPQRGPIQVSGTVTNLDEDTWTTINVYGFISATPLTTPAELAAAQALPADASVGDRVVEPGAYYIIDEIAPGDTVPFSFQIPRKLLPVTEAGVYWFGVQALGQGPDGRDRTADGRARTFLPLVRRRTEPLDLSVVVPLRRRISYASDGSVDDLEDWLTALSSGGRLRSLVDLGASGSSRAVTYLLDPALVAAVQQLADGNPTRSLRPTLAPDQGQGADEPDPSASPSPDPSPSPSPEPGAATQDATEPADPLAAEVQAAATDWLGRLRRALPGHEVLALPYGDLDVAGAADHSPRTYAVARRRAADAMAALDVPSIPAVAAPGGYLDGAALELTDPDDTVLVSDAMFGVGKTTTDETAAFPTTADGTAPTLVHDGDHEAVVSSTAPLSGPGPGEPRSILSVRQRTLAEAAVRALSDDPQPLLLTLPNDWNPVSSSGFFSGLDVGWLDLRSVTDLATGPSTPVSFDDLDYPRSQTRSEIGAPGFQAAATLTGAGQQLQGLLTRNDQVGHVVRDEALTTLSYTSRAQPTLSRASADGAERWIRERLARVHIEAPRAFTMTGTTGTFSTVIANDLPQPVTVSLRAIVSDGIEVSRPETVQVAPSGVTRVLLRAEARSAGIHRVTLRLTDADGAPLGDSDVLTVRALQVSNVIWVFIGAAGALLFGAIAFRLVRRVRAARRSPAPSPSPTAPEEATAVTKAEVGA